MVCTKGRYKQDAIGALGREGLRRLGRAFWEKTFQKEHTLYDTGCKLITTDQI